MQRALQGLLQKQCLRNLIEFKRRVKGAVKIGGYVAAFSDELILMHRLNWDTFGLNGYSVLRSRDVAEYRVFDSRDHWQCRASARLRLKPKAPRWALQPSMREFLGTEFSRRELLTFHIENTKPDVCYIGPVIRAAEKLVTIHDLDCNAEWSGLRRLKLEQITRVDFGGGYESALKWTAPELIRN